MPYILWQPQEGVMPDGAAPAIGPNFKDQWVREFGDDLERAITEFRTAAASHIDVGLFRW